MSEGTVGQGLLGDRRFGREVLVEVSFSLEMMERRREGEEGRREGGREGGREGERGRREEGGREGKRGKRKT